MGSLNFVSIYKNHNIYGHCFRELLKNLGLDSQWFYYGPQVQVSPHNLPPWLPLQQNNLSLKTILRPLIPMLLSLREKTQPSFRTATTSNALLKAIQNFRN